MIKHVIQYKIKPVKMPPKEIKKMRNLPPTEMRKTTSVARDIPRQPSSHKNRNADFTNRTPTVLIGRNRVTVLPKHTQ